MYRIVYLLIVIMFFSFINTQAQQYAFEVAFTDKNNTPYDLSAPSAYLSPRALARRAAQGIAIDSADLPVNPAYVDSILTLTGGVFHENSKWLNMCVVLLHDSSQILNLSGKPFVKRISLVGWFGTDLHLKPTTTGGSNAAYKTTTLDSGFYGSTWRETQMVRGNYLHDNGLMGQGKLIAVLDAGFVGANTHHGFDSLFSSGRLIDTHDFVFHEPSVFAHTEHGCSALSCMAGYIPGTFVGTAPLATYALYNTEYLSGEQPFEMDNLVCGAERADSIGTDIISISLGYTLFDPPASGLSFDSLDGTTTIAAKGVNMATQKGMLVVVSAGNNGLNSSGWGNHIGTPGDADSALTVGSVSYSGAIAPSSSYGPNAALVVKPDVAAVGDSAYIFTSGSVFFGFGTSFSTPQIAGWAACLWQANPSATSYQMRQAIISCASLYYTPDVQIGYGIPDFECASNTLDVKSIFPLSASATHITATPNPFSDNLNVLISDGEGDIQLVLTDIAGKVMLSKQHYYTSSGQQVVLPLDDLPGGMYLLRGISGTWQQIILIEKQ
jgi:serine protease AprX